MGFNSLVSYNTPRLHDCPGQSRNTQTRWWGSHLSHVAHQVNRSNNHVGLNKDGLMNEEVCVCVCSFMNKRMR